MIRTLTVILLLLSVAPCLRAQCTSSGPLAPSAASSVSFTGSDFSFSNASNVFSSDNSRATSAGLVALFNGETDYLQATGFGFSIPSTAIICGIEVEAEKSATGIGTVLGIGLSYVTDYSVRLIRNGAVAGNNKASGTHWTTSESYHTYGGSADIWGVSWTPADINAGNFGIAFSANIQGLAMLIPSVRLDHIRITVHYLEVVLPQEILYFKAAVQNNAVVVQWKTAGGDAEVQRSRDGQTWEPVKGAVNNQLRDAAPYMGKSFYRLVVTKNNGEKIYSATSAVQFDNKLRVQVFPNPATDHVIIRNTRERIIITDVVGRIVLRANEAAILADRKLNMSMLPPGRYFVIAGNEIFSIQKK